MRTTSGILAILFLLVSFGPAAADYDQLIQKVDREWKERTGDTGRMKDALIWAEQAYGEKPGFDAAWRAARACFWLCDRTEDRKTDLEYGQRGYKWAEKAIKANPDAVQGHYYYTICLGEYGKGLSMVKALAKGLGSKYEKAGKKAISIDGSYDRAGPCRALGRYYAVLPWPKYNFEKAEKNLLKALELAPKQARTYYYLAELYEREKQYDKAKAILKKLMELETTYPDSNFDLKYFKKIGKDLYEQLENK